MLPRDGDVPWEVVAHPGLRELGATLARRCGRRIPHGVDATRALTGGARSVRVFGEAERRIESKVTLDVHRGIAAGGRLLEVLRQENRRADVHGRAPELRQTVALDLDVLHPLRIGRRFD